MFRSICSFRLLGGFVVGSRSGLRRCLLSDRYRLLSVVFGSFRFTWPSFSLRESAGLLAMLYLAIRETPSVIPTVECSVPFVPFGSWEVRGWFPLGFEALPAFPSLLTLEFGI